MFENKRELSMKILKNIEATTIPPEAIEVIKLTSLIASFDFTQFFSYVSLNPFLQKQVLRNGSYSLVSLEHSQQL